MSPSPAVTLTTHTLTIHPLGIHQSYAHHTQRPPIVRSCSSASGHYIGPPKATSNTLCNIQTDVAINQLTFATHANDADTGMRGGVCSTKQHKPLTHHWKDISRSQCVLYT